LSGGLPRIEGFSGSLPYRFGNRRAIGSWIGSGVIGFRFRVVQDGLAASHFGGVLAADANFVAALGELLQSGCARADLNRYIAST
jgi:hypothetical protein